MNQAEILNALFKKYGLVYDKENPKNSDVFVTRNFKIITRAGIQKIQAQLDIQSDYEVVYIDPLFVALKGKFSYVDGGNTITATTFGEATVDRKEYIKTTITSVDGSSIEEINELLHVKGNVGQNPPYLMAIAEKRALSRGVLTLAGLYKLGVFGEDEATAFSKEIEKEIKSVSM